MIIAMIFAVAVLGFDQISKFFIYDTAARSIIGDFLWFESTLNTGVAFSMFEGKSVLFFVIAMVASVILVYLICSNKIIKSKFEKISLGLILGGTVANAIDRLIFGGVRDFIYLKFINFAIFNVADMAISIGVALFCFSIIFLRDKKKNDRA